jgi:hypothetical protein
MHRMTPAELEDITGRKRPKGQATWFLEYLAVDVPCDRQGPIMTAATYQALVAKRCGVLSFNEPAANKPRPAVKLRAAA